MRPCPICGVGERPRSPSGRLQPYCTPCRRLYQRERRSTEVFKQRRAQLGRVDRRERPAVHMLRSARSRARRKGLPFDLTLADISIPDKCPVLGIALASGSRASKANSPSLDRVVPALGYIRGNVRVISYRANELKRDATVEELEAVLAYVRSANAIT